jgi:hypothetical protein
MFALQERGGPSRDVEVAAVAAAVARFETLTGRRPRILIAKMGQVMPGGGREQGTGGAQAALLDASSASCRLCFSFSKLGSIALLYVSVATACVLIASPVCCSCCVLGVRPAGRT